MSKKIVVYFSHKGENYSKGKIVNLEKGNTEIAAEMISNILNADIFEIVAEKEYPFNYNECIEIAKKELRENSKIKLKQDIDIKEYDTIFVGYPNWWGTMPMPVWTFLEANEGSGLGKSESDIKKITSGAKVLKGLAINGSEVNNSEGKIRKWLEEVLK